MVVTNLIKNGPESIDISTVHDTYVISITRTEDSGYYDIVSSPLNSNQLIELYESLAEFLEENNVNRNNEPFSSQEEADFNS